MYKTVDNRADIKMVKQFVKENKLCMSEWEIIKTMKQATKEADDEFLSLMIERKSIAQLIALQKQILDLIEQEYKRVCSDYNSELDR